MKIAVSAESTIDMGKELLEQYDISTVPFNLFLGDKQYFDGDIAPSEIIEYVNKNKVLPKTGAVNEYQYEEHFGKLLKSYDAVVHFTLSSKMSSAYNNAVNVAKKFKNVYVIDSQSLSTGIALLAIYASKLVRAGESAEDVYEKCLKRVPFVQASFELKRVDCLYKGGRCSALTLLGANILRIRPQIIVKDGKMISGKKYRGNYSYVVKRYCEDVLEEFNNPDLSEAFVTYTTADKEIVDSAIESLKNRGFKNIHVTNANGTVTSHCGEDCLGILYINDGGEN